MTPGAKRARDPGRRRVASLKALRGEGAAPASGSRRRGARVHMDVYHTWLAAEFLLRRKLHEREPPKASYSVIGEKWGVTRTAIVKCCNKHGPAAQEMVRANLVDERNTAIFANAFRKLEDSEAITTAVRKMREPRNT